MGGQVLRLEIAKLWHHNDPLNGGVVGICVLSFSTP